MRQRFAILVVGSLLAGLALGKAAEGASEEGAGLRLVVEPSTPAFSTATAVLLRVRLKNDGDHCLPVLLDPVFASHRTGNRPFLLLRLEVRSTTDGLIAAEQTSPSEYMGLHAERLLLLDCGYFYGIDLRLSDPGWCYKLQKGKYRVRGYLEIKMRSFFEMYPEFLKQAEKIYGRNSDIIRAMLPEETLASAEAEFEILK